MNEEFFRGSEIARRMGVSPRWVRIIAQRAGSGFGFRPHSRMVLYTREEARQLCRLIKEKQGTSGNPNWKKP